MMIFEGFYHIWAWRPCGSLRFQNYFLFFSDTIESDGTKFHMKAYGCMGMKIYTNE